jgi:hypothetical protein
MLDILQKHLDGPTVGCVVDEWISTLSKEEQVIFEQLKASKVTVFADLYRDLSTTTELPFKLTAFRSHMKGYCTCQK